MGFKEIETGIKEELKEEEQFLLKLFQLEKIINKYKYQLIGLLVVVFGLFVGFQIKNYLHTQMLIKTNTAYEELLKNPKNTKELEILKQNKPLYALFMLQKAQSAKELSSISSSNLIIESIAKYQIAVLKGDKKSLQNYVFTFRPIYKNLALLNLERIYLKDKNHKKAEQIAKKIDDLELSPIAEGLLHYGIVK